MSGEDGCQWWWLCRCGGGGCCEPRPKVLGFGSRIVEPFPSPTPDEMQLCCVGGRVSTGLNRVSSTRSGMRSIAGKTMIIR